MSYFSEIRKTVARIPRGKVSTYGDVARAAGFPGTARQVAWALRDCSLYGIPWQRVLGSGGRILLQGVHGSRQRELLKSENVRFVRERVDMSRHAFQFRTIDGSTNTIDE